MLPWIGLDADANRFLGIRPALKSAGPALHDEFNRVSNQERTTRISDSGVHEHAIKTGLHGGYSVGDGCAVRIDYCGNLGVSM